MKHDLKTWPEEFKAIRDGIKTAEWRIDDRGFSIGDNLFFREWDWKEEQHTGQWECATVTHIVRGPRFGIPCGYVMMSIKKI